MNTALKNRWNISYKRGREQKAFPSRRNFLFLTTMSNRLIIQLLILSTHFHFHNLVQFPSLPGKLLLFLLIQILSLRFHLSILDTKPCSGQLNPDMGSFPSLEFLNPHSQNGQNTVLGMTTCLTVTSQLCNVYDSSLLRLEGKSCLVYLSCFFRNFYLSVHKPLIEWLLGVRQQAGR